MHRARHRCNCQKRNTGVSIALRVVMESSPFADILALSRHPDFMEEPGAYACSPLSSCFGLELHEENREQNSRLFETLLGAFEIHPPPSNAIFVVLRGMELNLDCCERISRCIAPTSSSHPDPAFDVCVFDLAPQLYAFPTPHHYSPSNFSIPRDLDYHIFLLAGSLTKT